MQGSSFADLFVGSLEAKLHLVFVDRYEPFHHGTLPHEGSAAPYNLAGMSTNLETDSFMTLEVCIIV